MVIFTPKALKSQAGARLQPVRQDARRLVLIHTGIVVLLSLFSSGLSMYLDYQISDTGGLSGLGARSILETVQTVLQYATTLFTPFWQAGFVLIAIRFASGQKAQNKDLLSGFSRFSSILSYQLLLTVLYFLIAIGCAYLASFIFSLTPFSAPLMELVEPMLASGTFDIESLPLDQLLQAYVPMLAIYGVVLVPVLVFLSYSLRLSTYLIMDDTCMSGLRALGTSMNAMRGHRLSMLKLDLSFWWYYLLEGILLVVCYLDMILPLLGIELPFHATIAYFVCLILYCVLELVLHLWKKPHVDTTYALAYQSIIHPDHLDPSTQN